MVDDEPEWITRMWAELDAKADAWASEIKLTELLHNASAPMTLNATAPPSVRNGFRSRMEANMNEIVRQAFSEGFLRGGEEAIAAVRSRMGGTASSGVE